MIHLAAMAEIGMEFYFIFIVLAIIVVILLSILGKFLSLWFQAFVSGTPIPLFNIIGMSLRKIPPRLIVNARITAYKAGLKDISVSDLETHYLAGGHVPEVVAALEHPITRRAHRTNRRPTACRRAKSSTRNRALIRW